MNSSRRHFIRQMGTGLAAAGSAASALACTPQEDASAPGSRKPFSAIAGGSEDLLLRDPDQVTPAPLGYDRLPLEWHQERARVLKGRVADRGVEAILLSNDQNAVYFSGCFRGSGERSTWVLFRMDEEDTVYWYSPGIDRDLIESWWCTENEYYFGFPHAEGGFPNRGQVVQGPQVDLFEWMLEGLKGRGLAGGTVATDWTLSQGQVTSVRKVIPGTRFVNIQGDCLAMQQVKTPEELRLIQRAYHYFDRVHAFARDYILERGTELTDFELGQGQFFAGHQPPFIALGDYTVLEENMTFSMEPGLYDSERGIGINPSDNLRVTASRGVRFSGVPFSKEWSFLEL